MTIKMLSGGAAQGLVGACTAQFEAATGLSIEATFGPVGALLQKLRDGADVDIVILTDALISGLVGDGRVSAGTQRDLGLVHTAIAGRAGDQPADVSDGDRLARALRAADAIYFPDPAIATAGSHFAKVIDRLGLTAELGSRFRMCPSGHAAMRALAAHEGPAPIGCTQTTEILATPGARVFGALPKGYELATTYAAGVMSASGQRHRAGELIAMLAAKVASDGAALGFSPGR